MSESDFPTHAFVLGAGLGTRLRPLTDHIPKPLIPLWNRPLITYAFDHLIGVGVRQIIVNTHWCPESYQLAFPGGAWKGVPIHFRHEPVLLETAGGISNIADLLPPGRSFWVYNGDIFATADLQPLLRHHLESDDIATLMLRSHGNDTVVSYDASTRRVLDLRHLLATGHAPTHQFSGIYLCRPEFLAHLRPGKIESARSTFIDIIRRNGRLGGVVCDDGEWLDLGDRQSYLEAHRRVPAPTVAPVPNGVTLQGVCAVSPLARVEPGAVLDDCVIWPGAAVRSTARLTRCIVRNHQCAEGTAVDQDF